MADRRLRELERAWGLARKDSHRGSMQFASWRRWAKGGEVLAITDLAELEGRT